MASKRSSTTHPRSKSTTVVISSPSRGPFVQTRRHTERAMHAQQTQVQRMDTANDDRHASVFGRRGERRRSEGGDHDGGRRLLLRVCHRIQHRHRASGGPFVVGMGHWAALLHVGHPHLKAYHRHGSYGMRWPRYCCFRYASNGIGHRPQGMTLLLRIYRCMP